VRARGVPLVMALAVGLPAAAESKPPDQGGTSGRFNGTMPERGGTSYGGSPFVAARVTSLSHTAASRSVEVAAVAGMSIGGAFADELTVAGRFHGEAGGGSAGFEGKLLGQIAVGLPLRLGGGNAVVGRIGFAAALEGNDGYLYRGIEAPRGELGYDVQLSQMVSLDLGFHGGPALATKYRASDLSTSYGLGIATGPFLWLGANLGSWTLDLHAEGSRIGTPDGVLITGDGTSCVTSPAVRLVQMCLDAAYLADTSRPSTYVITAYWNLWFVGN
jgi:hypothetical protein